MTLGTTPDLVILSGGAETTALSVVEAAMHAGLRPLVVAFETDSLFVGLESVCDCIVIGGASRTEQANALATLLSEIPGAEPLAVFPTEDDGLGLMHDIRGLIPGRVRFSRGRRLERGGLDKSELFTALQAAGLDASIAPTLVLSSPDALPEAFDALGHDCIVKPAVKPWRAAIGPRGLKVIARRRGESVRDVVDRLRMVWRQCSAWVAQTRLASFDGIERSAIVVRGLDGCLVCEVRERFKDPPMGGTAVWVESCATTDLGVLARSIAEAIDLVGICEMSFLADADGRPRLLELNTRPWLQIELIERSGFPIILAGQRALRDQPIGRSVLSIQPHHWLQPERWLLAMLRGDRRGALRCLAEFLATKPDQRIWSVWSSSLPRVRWRWVLRMLRRRFLRLR